MCRWMPMGLPSLVVDKVELRQLDDDRLAVSKLELGFDGAPNDLLGRNPIDLLGPWTHELNAATRDDEGF